MDRFLLFPLLAPAILLALGNEDFGFDPAGWLDSFVYVGYFWHYPEHLWVFDDNSNYKISRLPWILPGYAVHALLGATGASYVLAYLTLATGAAALYLLIRDALEDRTAAAAIGVAWACCTWVHGIGGWNYHALAASAYYLTACWLIVRAALGRSPGLSAALAGAFFASSVHTHAFLITFAPLVALLHWAVLPRTVDKPVARSLGAASLVLAGGVVLTMALAVINRATGGAWLFFMPQLEQALKLSSQPGYEQWWMADASQWLPSARYLVIPLALLAAGAAVLLRRQPDSDRRRVLVLVASAWAALAIMCFFQFVRQQTTLDYNYMAFALYMPAFICGGAVLAWGTRAHPDRPWLIVGVATAIMLATLAFLLPTPLPGAMEALSSMSGLARFPPIVGPLAFSLAGVGTTLFLRGSGRVVGFAVWFSVVNAWVAPAPSAYGLGTPGYHRQMLTMFREADRFTTDLDPTLIGIKYWLSDEQITTPRGDVQLRHVFDSFAATRAWFANLLGRVAPSPRIDQLTIADLERGACIGVLSSVERQSALRQEIESQFEALGRPLSQVAERRFESRDLSFALTVLTPQPPDAGRQGPPCAQGDGASGPRAQ